MSEQLTSGRSDAPTAIDKVEYQLYLDAYSAIIKWARHFDGTMHYPEGIDLAHQLTTLRQRFQLS